MIKEWNELRSYEKIFRILSMILAFATIVLAIYSFADTAHKEYMAIMELCLGLTQVCQAISFWRTQRNTAITCLCCGVALLAVVVIIVVL